MTLLGGVLSAVTGFFPFFIIFFVGIALFASFNTESMLTNYVLANTSQALIRKRYYYVFIPFYIVSIVLTFNKAPLLILWKEEYFKGFADADGQMQTLKITKGEYLALRNEQRHIYSTQLLDRQFMQDAYSVKSIGYKKKKRRLVVISIFAALMLTMVTVPGGIALAAIYEAVFIPVIILWFPDYKDAKILQQAYDRAMGQNNM